MENNYSNYDMLDKMIANSKKAKSWTVFWVVLLCLMAGAVLWLAHTVRKKDRIISELTRAQIQTSAQYMELKSNIIDSLVENCNDAQNEILKKYDSVISQSQVALDIVNSESQSGSDTKFTPVQKEELKKINTSIQKVKSNIKTVQAEIRKSSTRLFIQYNNQKDIEPINRLQAVLKAKSEYVIAPPEYIDGAFATVIKFYNYQNTDEENRLKALLAKYFGISEKNIVVKYEKNEKIKTTVELWIGTRAASIKTLQMKQTN